jgi:hypothetical protein
MIDNIIHFQYIYLLGLKKNETAFNLAMGVEKNGQAATGEYFSKYYMLGYKIIIYYYARSECYVGGRCSVGIGYTTVTGN